MNRLLNAFNPGRVHPSPLPALYPLPKLVTRSPLKNKIQLTNITIESIVGQGGFGTAYKATVVGEGVCVFKEITDAGLCSHEMKLFKLDIPTHKNVMKIVGVVTGLSHQGCAYVVQYIEPDVNWKAHTLTDYDLARVLRGTVEGLLAFHNAKLLHRDIKPQNIIYGKKNPNDPSRAYLIDFGMACTIDDTKSVSLQCEAHIGGTPKFIIPSLVNKTVSYNYGFEYDLYAIAQTIKYIIASEKNISQLVSTKLETYANNLAAEMESYAASRKAIINPHRTLVVLREISAIFNVVHLQSPVGAAPQPPQLIARARLPPRNPVGTPRLPPLIPSPRNNNVNIVPIQIFNPQPMLIDSMNSLASSMDICTSVPFDGEMMSIVSFSIDGRMDTS